MKVRRIERCGLYPAEDCPLGHSPQGRAGTDEDRLLYDIVSKDRLLCLSMGQDRRSKMDV